MAKNFTAQVRDWSEKALRNADLVVKDAAQGVLGDMTERQASIKDTGSFVIGKVPVDTGYLIGSQIAELNGSVVSRGTYGTPPDYSAAVAGMELGDTVAGYFTAEYAPMVEYGTSKFPGRFFVREAISGWQARVDASAAKFKD